MGLELSTRHTQLDIRTFNLAFVSESFVGTFGLTRDTNRGCGVGGWRLESQLSWTLIHMPARGILTGFTAWPLQDSADYIATSFHYRRPPP